MIEGMAPVALFVDEIDKGLGGAGGGGDSGTSSRVLGSFLTWLQECKAPVFTVVTANRVDGLPPELLRRGRFDQVFSVGMPGAEARREVLEIHLRKRNRNIAQFKEEDLLRFDKASMNYVPAEIESAVKDAIIAAFNGGVKSTKLSMNHIVSALEEMVPMSKSHKATVDRIIEWARDHATPVDYEESASAATVLPVARVLRTRSRS
jgi:SpoVK/Ycf46/Vps4 family AAA+-type ATPase